MDFENIAACSPPQLNRRATEDYASRTEMGIASENKDVCGYLLYSFQHAICRFPFGKGQRQMNNMASCLFLYIIEKTGKPLLGLGGWSSLDLAVAVSIQ
jgi:hypothetical protein